MRKLVTQITTIALTMSGLALSPAQAIGTPVNYLCATGQPAPNETTGVYTITDGVVSAGTACTGDVVIPEGVTTLGASAFENAMITSIDLPASFRIIGNYALGETTALTSIAVNSNNDTYSSADGILFDKTFATLVIYPAGKNVPSYSIPAGVTSIGDEAFNETKLTSIIIPASVTSIGVAAFAAANSLTSIIIPASVTSIGEAAFSWTAQLDYIYFLGNAPVVGSSLFYQSNVTKVYVKATALESFSNQDPPIWNLIPVEVDAYDPATGDGVIRCSISGAFTISNNVLTERQQNVCAGAAIVPAGVTRIDHSVFERSALLESITIPASVTFIGDYAFEATTSLTTVTFEPGSQLTTMGDYVFAESALRSITIPAQLTEIPYYAFGESKSLETVAFEPGSTLVTIGDSAFLETDALKKITIPASVTTIGAWAFYKGNNAAVTSIYFLGTPTNIHSRAFAFGSSEVNKTTMAYVKRENLAAFTPVTDGRWFDLILKAGNSVTYNANGASSGIVPTDSIPLYAEGESATVLANTGALAKTGYTFAGWNTQSDGLGTTYASSGFASLDIGTAEVVLYAKWTQNPSAPIVEIPTQAVACSSAVTPLKTKKKFTSKSLAVKTCLTTVSPNAKVTIKVAKSSKKVCTKSGSKLKTLKAGNCIVTFTVQEPKPKGGKKPKATKTVKTLVVQ